MVMMSLGLFVFMAQTAAYQTLQNKVAWKYGSNARVGFRPARQFLGPDDETITLAGVLYPGFTGGEYTLGWLRELGDAGEALPLIDGMGQIYGLFTLDSLDTTHSEFFADGKARKIEFSLSLTRVDDDRIDQRAGR